MGIYWVVDEIRVRIGALGLCGSVGLVSTHDPPRSYSGDQRGSDQTENNKNNTINQESITVKYHSLLPSLITHHNLTIVNNALFSLRD